MKMNKYRIKIKFVNNELTGMIDELKDFLIKDYEFEYDDSTTICDMFKWLMQHFDGDSLSLEDEYLRDHFHVIVNRLDKKMQLDYNLKKFIESNNISTLNVLFIMCPSGGAGAYIRILGTIRINPDEQRHKYIPHVHVYKNRKIDNDHEIRINLNDLTQLKHDKKSIDDLFSKKQKKILFDVLENNRDKLINYYYSVQNGEYLEPIYIDYNGKQVQFK